MHAEDLVVDQGGDWDLIEDADELLEQAAILLVWSSQLGPRTAFPLQQGLVESINMRQAVALVVAAEQEEILGILDFVAQKQ